MDKSLIILALETLREQVSEDAYEHGVNQKRLDRIDEQIDLMKSKDEAWDEAQDLVVELRALNRNYKYELYTLLCKN